MRYKFNQKAAIITFAAVIIVWAVAVGVSKLQYNQDPTFIGSLVYGILGLFASIITGLIVNKGKPIKKSDFDLNDLNENENEKENERRSKNGKTEKETSRKTKKDK